MVYQHLRGLPLRELDMSISDIYFMMMIGRSAWTMIKTGGGWIGKLVGLKGAEGATGLAGKLIGTAGGAGLKGSGILGGLSSLGAGMGSTATGTGLAVAGAAGVSGAIVGSLAIVEKGSSSENTWKKEADKKVKGTLKLGSVAIGAAIGTAIARHRNGYWSRDWRPGRVCFWVSCSQGS